MEWLALALVVSTILYLIDKNGKWRAFWAGAAVVAIIAVIGIAALMYYDHKGAQKAEAHQRAVAQCALIGDTVQRAECEQLAEKKSH